MEEAEQAPQARTPWLHAGLYAIGAHLISLFAQILFVRSWLSERIGSDETQALFQDPEGVATFLNDVAVLDLLLFVVAGQGVAVVYTFGLWRALRRGGFAELGLPEGRVGLTGLLIGTLQGAGMIVVVVALGAAFGGLSFGGWAAADALPGGGYEGVAMAAGLLFLSAFSEEVMFRGYLFRILMERGSVWMALVASTLFFGAFHGYNPGSGPLGILGTGLAGLLFALIVLRDGHLWRAVGVHWGWNFVMGFVASLPVSGLQIQGLVKWDDASPLSQTWLGGEFGPEGGLAGVLALSVAVMGVSLQIRRDGVKHPPEPPPPPPVETEGVQPE